MHRQLALIPLLAHEIFSSATDFAGRRSEFPTNHTATTASSAAHNQAHPHTIQYGDGLLLKEAVRAGAAKG